MHFIKSYNNCHKKGYFANVCLSRNKSINYLDNQNTPPTIADEALDKGNFFIGAFFDISNEVKNSNQQINTIAEETNAEWSVNTNAQYQLNTNTQYQQDQHL